MTNVLSRRAVLMLAGTAIVGGMLTATPFDHAIAGSYYTGLVKGTAVGGYDPVAYFKANKPVRGSKEFTTQWDGVTWRFSSAANRDAFVANPTNFAPKYGGYCAYAAALGSKAKGDPRAWKIVGGKLYLNYNQSIKRKWERKQSFYIQAADKKWK